MKRKLDKRIDFLLTRAQGYNVCGNRSKAHEMTHEAFEMITQLLAWGLISTDEADSYYDIIKKVYVEL